MTSPHPLPLNPAQREAVEHPGGSLLVLAGAGSGKTRVLTARIAHLITKHGVAPQRIFAVTFTNKAAGEMRTRIAQLLGSDPRGLWIGTFHSLSARLLRREAPLLGFGPNFTIYDPMTPRRSSSGCWKRASCRRRPTRRGLFMGSSRARRIACSRLRS